MANLALVNNNFLVLIILKLLIHEIRNVDNPTLCHRSKSIEKNIEKRRILTQSIEKSFLIDPLNTNNAVYNNLLTLRAEIFAVDSSKNCGFYGIYYHD